jgi:hypothetical protein
MCYSVSNSLGIFWCLFYCAVIRQYAGGYFNFLIFLRIALCLRHWHKYLFWRKFYRMLRRMYIVLLQDGLICRCLSGAFSCFCCLRIFVYASNSILLSDYLSVLLFWFNISCPLCLCLFSFSVCRILFRIFCSGGFIVIYCLSFCLLWKTFIPLSILNYSFAG